MREARDFSRRRVHRNALGAPVNDQRLDEAKNWFNRQDSTDRAKQRRQEGWTVNMGETPHCHGEYELAEFLRGMWRVMVEADPENAMIIDDDVGYFWKGGISHESENRLRDKLKFQFFYSRS